MKLLTTIRNFKQFIKQTINIFNYISIKLWPIPAFISSMVSSGIKFGLHLFRADAQYSILTTNLFYFQELQKICHYFHASLAGKIWHAAQLLFSLILYFIIINATTSLFHNRKREKTGYFENPVIFVVILVIFRYFWTLILLSAPEQVITPSALKACQYFKWSICTKLLQGKFVALWVVNANGLAHKIPISKKQWKMCIFTYFSHTNSAIPLFSALKMTDCDSIVIPNHRSIMFICI